LAYESPGKPAGFVNDFAGVMTSAQKAALENKVGNFERPAGVELSVVTVKSLGGDTVENFAEKLFQEWGIGKKKVDNGILFLVAPDDRQVRIEVGYGMEPVVTDAASSIVLRKIVLPQFSTGNYYDGIDKGVDAIIKLVEGDPEMARYVKDNTTSATADGQGASGQSGEEPNVFVLILVIVIVIILLSSRGGRSFLLGMLLGGLGRGGSGGGGFGGFGGGRSGGGGASGRW
jgi:uncharacterized protein